MTRSKCKRLRLLSFHEVIKTCLAVHSTTVRPIAGWPLSYGLGFIVKWILPSYRWQRSTYDWSCAAKTMWTGQGTQSLRRSMCFQRGWIRDPRISCASLRYHVYESLWKKLKKPCSPWHTCFGGWWWWMGQLTNGASSTPKLTSTHQQAKLFWPQSALFVKSY